MCPMNGHDPEGRFPATTRLWKAHATGNAFVLADDQAVEPDPTRDMVAELCDVSRGIGADGYLGCVHREGRWFMDYRNADGSEAEMCGNGIRAFVDHLRRTGLLDLGVGEETGIGTRGGVRRVRALGPRPAQVATPVWERRVEIPTSDEGVGSNPTEGVEEWYSVDMGPALANAAADMRVGVPGLEGTFEGIRVSVPNPHVVVDVATREALREAALPGVDARVAPPLLRPDFDPVPPAGINLELVVDVTPAGARTGHLLMRVLERGVGETQSCGTGCCAAAVAAARRRGEGAPTSWVVEVPGGSVHVDLVDGGRTSVVLSGPATPIARISPA